MREEFAASTGRLGWQSLKDVLHIAVDIMSVEPGGMNQAHHRRCALAGTQKLAFFGDRIGCQACRHCAEPAGHVPATRHQSIRLFRRRFAARRPTPGVAGASIDAAIVETVVCRQPATVG